MRWNGINGGTIKTFLILVLLIANIAIAVSHQRAFSQPLGNAPAAREARALPGQPRTQP